MLRVVLQTWALHAVWGGYIGLAILSRVVASAIVSAVSALLLCWSLTRSELRVGRDARRVQL